MIQKGWVIIQNIKIKSPFKENITFDSKEGEINKKTKPKYPIDNKKLSIAIDPPPVCRLPYGLLIKYLPK